MTFKQIGPLEDEACGKCKHWRPVRDNATSGKCWRYPPRQEAVLTPNGPVEVPLLPTTQDDDLCGEFKAKPAPSPYPEHFVGEPDQKLRGDAP